MAPSRLLSHAEARRFYNRFGKKQDVQGWYENPALADLVEHLPLHAVVSVCEFGCGTGRLARELLKRHLPPNCNYIGLDISESMLKLSREQLAPWRKRLRLVQTGGEMDLDLKNTSQDIFLSTYVLDLLDETDIRKLLAEARRVLRADGRLALASLTFGQGLISRCIDRLWRSVHAINPAWVGGCRPLELTRYLDGNEWKLEHHRIICRWGICSEVVIARPV